MRIHAKGKVTKVTGYKVTFSDRASPRNARLVIAHARLVIAHEGPAAERGVGGAQKPKKTLSDSSSSLSLCPANVRNLAASELPPFSSQ